MILFERALASHAEHDAKRASVCSTPPSEVGFGATAFVVVRVAGAESGRK